ncbi:chromosome segregation ATPase [Kibdelosporangium banguiense]|uniref:Chromosome segregation ATPase n=1 Tax=Kibdelosporangium banguiense TaxID=1365924 RepID=A0ABS4TK48_9PSEU|nr:hypothetical protein [Kibdelosporangium banguiense]MBP2324797.1 chromosome segregation ATPase [Kibdelosporangium banguiense]
MAKLALEPAFAPFKEELAKVRTALSQTLKALEEKAAALDDAAKDSSDAVQRFSPALRQIEVERTQWNEQSDALRIELTRIAEQLAPLPERIGGVVRDHHSLGSLATHIADNQKAMAVQINHLRRLVLWGLLVFTVLFVVIGVLVIR